MFLEERGDHSKNKKIVILFIEGGIGDHLMATPLLRVARKIFPKESHYLTVMSMFHEVFGYVDPAFNDGDHIIPTNPNIDILFSMRCQLEDLLNL